MPPKFEAAPHQTQSDTAQESVSRRRKQEEPPVPWEHCIQRFETVTVLTRTIPERYNYWNIEAGHLLTGYHSVKETSGERNFGEMVRVSGQEYILLPDASISSSTFRKVFEAIKADMQKRGISVKTMNLGASDRSMAA